MDVRTGVIVSSTRTAVVHAPEKSLRDAERDRVIPQPVVTTPSRDAGVTVCACIRFACVIRSG